VNKYRERVQRSTDWDCCSVVVDNGVAMLTPQFHLFVARRQQRHRV
jgi:hypothetical protein